MFIVWGKKRVERKLGRVADFCPICRDVRAFQLIRVGLAGHIYYVSFGEGKLAGHLIRCEQCGVELGVDANAHYTHFEQDRRVELEALIRNTFPNLREAYATRLEIEARIKRTRSAFSGDDYKRYLMEPFALLNPQIERRYANSTQMDKESGIGCLATILIGALLFFGSMRFNGPTQDKILLSALLFVGLGTTYTFIQMHLGPGGFFRAKLLVPLVQCLKPVQPTRDDLADCFERCKTLGLRIGKVAKQEEVWSRLERSMAGFDP